MMKICVYCGSRIGRSPIYREAAEMVGRYLANNGITLVYGGGHVGLMGVVADAALQAGGEVVGVIPHELDNREIAHAGLTKLHVVKDMHERKLLMAELSDAFIALPGGPGTQDETWEQLTWLQLGIHSKPTGYLNVGGYYDPLALMWNRMVDEGFVKQEENRLFIIRADIEQLIRDLQSFKPLPEKSWGVKP